MPELVIQRLHGAAIAAVVDQLAALRISWKPVLGALVTAIILGAVADWLFPRADTLVQVLGGLRSYWGLL